MVQVFIQYANFLNIFNNFSLLHIQKNILLWIQISLFHFLDLDAKFSTIDTWLFLWCNNLFIFCYLILLCVSWCNKNGKLPLIIVLILFRIDLLEILWDLLITWNNLGKAFTLNLLFFSNIFSHRCSYFLKVQTLTLSPNIKFKYYVHK